MEEQSCQCGSGRPYGDCCGPLHRGLPAPTPLALMRSRYCAFRRGEVEHLLATSHPSLHAPDERAVLERACSATRWLALRILDAPPATGDRAEVEFVAFHEGLPIGQHHERSRFVREGGRWLYASGRILPAVDVGRNDPCWCGSGRKRKACHG